MARRTGVVPSGRVMRNITNKSKEVEEEDGWSSSGWYPPRA